MLQKITVALPFLLLPLSSKAQDLNLKYIERVQTNRHSSDTSSQAVSKSKSEKKKEKSLKVSDLKKDIKKKAKKKKRKKS